MGWFSDANIFSKVTGLFSPKTTLKVAKDVAPYAGLAALAYGTMGGSLGALGSMGAGGSSGLLGTMGNAAKTLMPLATGALNYYGQQQTNAANAEQAQKQMDFQAQQTGTSYQRGVADMQKAGLNPMLAYSQGGAQSGGGAQAQIGDSISKGANSALSSAQTLQEIQNMTQQHDLIQAQRGLTDAQKNQTNAQTLVELNKPGLQKAELVGKERLNERMLPETEKTYMEAQIMRDTLKDQEAQISSAAKLKQAEAQREKYRLTEEGARSRFWGDVGKGGVYVEKGSEAINSAASAVGKIMRVLKP